MTYTIGVFGSAESSTPTTLKQAKKLGNILGKYKGIVITGAGSGLPFIAATEAAKGGSKIWGFSPAINRDHHQRLYPDHNLSIYAKLVFVPRSFPFILNDQACKKYRNVISTATCDAGIILAGRWGSLNEFTNLIDMGKTIGVLTGTGGIADYLPLLVSKIKKEGTGKVIFSRQPQILVNKIIHELSS